MCWLAIVEDIGMRFIGYGIKNFLFSTDVFTYSREISFNIL